MCFAPSKMMNYFQLAEKEKSPVKINKFNVNQKYGNLSIVMNEKTKLSTAPRQLNFQFDETTTNKQHTISGLQKISPGQLVSLKAHISQMGPVRKAAFANEDGPNKQEGIIVDPTASIRIILWGSSVNTMEQNKTYIIKNSRLRKDRNGELYVNSPKQEEMSAEECLPFPTALAKVGLTQQDNITEINAVVLGVNAVHMTLMCGSCGQKAKLSASGKRATCTSCKMTQHVNTCTQHWFARIYVRNEDNQQNRIHLAAYNNIIRHLAAMSPPLNLTTCSEDELTEHILDIERLKITFDNIANKIIAVEKLSSPEQ